MGSYYEVAQICENGHLITEWYNETPSSRSDYCSKCGEKTITQCLSCNASIRGHHVFPNVHFIGVLDIPSFCHNCGNSYPWTKKVIDNAVELVALDDGLSREQKEIIQSTFPDLLIETPTTPVAIAKYKKYIGKAQKEIKNGLRQVLTDVVSEAAKKSIWP